MTLDDLKGMKRPQQVAALIDGGYTAREIADLLGITPHTVASLRSVARAKGLLARNEPRDGRDQWQRLWRKGAAPLPGAIGDMLQAMTPDEVNRLVELLDRRDTTLADLLLRIVRERLDDPRG